MTEEMRLLAKINDVFAEFEQNPIDNSYVLILKDLKFPYRTIRRTIGTELSYVLRSGSLAKGWFDGAIRDFVKARNLQNV